MGLSFSFVDFSFLFFFLFYRVPLALYLALATRAEVINVINVNKVPDIAAGLVDKAKPVRVLCEIHAAKYEAAASNRTQIAVQNDNCEFVFYSCTRKMENKNGKSYHVRTTRIYKRKY